MYTVFWYSWQRYILFEVQNTPKTEDTFSWVKVETKYTRTTTFNIRINSVRFRYSWMTWNIDGVYVHSKESVIKSNENMNTYCDADVLLQDCYNILLYFHHFCMGRKLKITPILFLFPLQLKFQSNYYYSHQKRSRQTILYIRCFVLSLVIFMYLSVKMTYFY